MVIGAGWVSPPSGEACAVQSVNLVAGEQEKVTRERKQQVTGEESRAASPPTHTILLIVPM